MLSMGVYSQTYCTPAFSLGCSGGDVIDSFEIPAASFSHQSSGCSAGAYGDFTAQTINLSAGTSFPFTIEHGYVSQLVRVWIDFNNDGTFTDAAPELVASTTSSITATTNSTIVIPSGIATGNYRMRVATRYSSDPIPCNTSGYGEAHDYTVHIGAPPSCISPSNLSTSNITSNSATITWAASTSTVGVGYEYYLSTTNTAPTNTTVATGSVAPTVTTKNLTSLLAATNYYVWVRTLCSATDKSTWSSRASFTTLCASIVPSYTNDFTTFPGNCWSVASGGSPATGSSGTTSYWSDGGFLNSGTTGSARINLYYINRVGWLKTNDFNLSAGGYRVKFDYGVTEYDDVGPSAMGSDDVIQLVISNDGGATWTVLHTWNAANAPSNTSTTFSLDLPTYTSANTKFAFYGSDGTVDDSEDYEFFVDNFIVESIQLSTSEVAGSKNSIKVYPNPFINDLNISDIKNVKSVSIIDIAGRLVKTIEKPEATLHLAELKSGIYMIVLNMKDGSKQTIKTIKK